MNATVLAGILILVATFLGVCLATSLYFLGRIVQQFTDAQRVANLAFITAARAEMAAQSLSMPKVSEQEMEKMHQQMAKIMDTSVREHRVRYDNQLDPMDLV